MSENEELSHEELEAQEGESLPPREVMSIASTDPGDGLIVPISEDAILPIDDPEPV